jgi:ketosteroid isomerase-like protein
MVRLIDLFDGFCRVFVNKNVTEVMKLFAEDASILGPGFSISGKDEIRKFFDSEVGKVEDYTINKKSILEQANEIAVEWQVHHRYKSTGKEINANGATLITAEKGLIKSLRDYCDFPPF